MGMVASQCHLDPMDFRRRKSAEGRQPKEMSVAVIKQLCKYSSKSSKVLSLVGKKPKQLRFQDLEMRLLGGVSHDSSMWEAAAGAVTLVLGLYNEILSKEKQGCSSTL